ncbi:uncharacterized protein LOC124495431 isoform X1 [Dermatophagoides farinae]|uniref:uncharacterized protein LOC124495431 isoform X1 n=1 Tax=Dermatophagoides farinae TaxID=6954 RepID=UPI003F63FE71
MPIKENNQRNFCAKNSSISNRCICYTSVFINRKFHKMRILTNSMLNHEFFNDNNIDNRRIECKTMNVKHSNHQSLKYHHCHNNSQLSHSSLSNCLSSSSSIKMAMLNIIIIILVMMISSLSFRTVIAAESKSDTFNIDKLLEYNELVSCFGQMHKEFEQCNKKGAEKAKSFLGQIELSQEWNRRLKCCGTWKLRDCWMKAARQKCTKIQADMVFKLPDLIMPALVEECQEYTIESGKCSLPIWLIIVVITVVCTLILSCCCGIIYCIRRRINKQRYRANGLPPTGDQRSYTMTTIQKSSTSYKNGLGPINKMNGINSYRNNNHQNHNGHYHCDKQNNHHKHNHHQNNSIETILSHKQPTKETLDNVDSEELKVLNPQPNSINVNKNNIKHIERDDDIDGDDVVVNLV